jgi:hypothetical protein
MRNFAFSTGGRRWLGVDEMGGCTSWLNKGVHTFV